MEIDTGTSLSVVNDKTFKTLSQGPEKLTLHKTSITLHTFSGNEIQPQGVTEVPVKARDGRNVRLPLMIVTGNQPSLMGWDWLEQLQLDWREVKKPYLHISHSRT